MIGRTNAVIGNVNKNEKVLISLKSNQGSDDSLLNKKITINYNNQNTELTWLGDVLIINIPVNVNYNISVEDIEGYKKPNDQNYIAESGNTRILEFLYETTILNVEITSNQNEELSSGNITLKYDLINKSIDFIGKETKNIKIPLGSSYTLEFSEISNYKKPDNISGTTTLAIESKTVKYESEFLTINVSGIDSGYTITVEDIGSQTEATKLYKIPFGTNYNIISSDINEYITPEKQSFTANQITREVNIVYNKVLIITTIFDDSNGANELTQENVENKDWIKGKRCLVKKTEDGVAICYLDENNSELFHDGSTTAKLDGTMGQWMTYIPEYYYFIDETESNKHKLKITQYKQNSWKKSREVLLGVTEAVNKSNKLWSQKGGQSTGNLTSTVFHNYAIALGEGFDIIDYESHCKIAHLFYAKYANRNPQEMSQFGYGENSYTRTIGSTSSLGNNDGKTLTQISFLGIEDFYGGKYEWMSGIHSNNSIYYIYDGYEPDKIPTANYRTIDVGGSTRSGYINKVYWKEFGDMIPTEVSGSSTTHYCDYGYVAYSGWRVARRSYYSTVDNGGVACFNANDSSSYSYSSIGSRIQYRGNIQIIEDPNEFIQLPVGF